MCLCSSELQGMGKEAVMAWRDWGTRQQTSLSIAGLSEPIFESGILGTGKWIVPQSNANVLFYTRFFYAFLLERPLPIYIVS
jgi:hypothetical protein